MEPRRQRTHFVVEGLKHIYQIGTLVPSSRWLASAMVPRPLGNGGPKRVLEVGAGTGAVTRRILPHLDRGDELHLVEVNPAFCRHLDARVLAPYRRARPDVRVELHRESVLTAPLPPAVDSVVCTLPFRAFTPDEVRAMLSRLARLMAEDGQLTYMQYVGVRYLKWPFVTPTRRRELRRIDAICMARGRRYRLSRRFVPLNILPSYVTHWAKRP